MKKSGEWSFTKKSINNTRQPRAWGPGRKRRGWERGIKWQPWNSRQESHPHLRPPFVEVQVKTATPNRYVQNNHTHKKKKRGGGSTLRPSQLPPTVPWQCRVRTWLNVNRPTVAVILPTNRLITTSNSPMQLAYLSRSSCNWPRVGSCELGTASYSPVENLRCKTEYRNLCVPLSHNHIQQIASLTLSGWD